MCTNLKDKKLMLKSYTVQKITQIMKKTEVEFFLVKAQVYHCLLFLDLPLVISGGVQSSPRQPVGDYQWSTVCYCLPQLLIYSICNQQSGLSTTGWCRVISVGKVIASP